MQVTNQSIAPKAGAISKKTPFSQVLAMPSYQRMLETAVPNPQKRASFATILISAVNSTPKLKECEPDSIVTAGLQAMSLNLQPGLGDCWLIPYGSKCNFQMGARGYIQLAMRSGQYLSIDTIEVREGEYKGRDRSSGKPTFEFISDDDVREELPIIGYLATFELLNGFRAQEYFSHAKMLKWASRYSQAFDINLYEKYLVYLQTGEGMTDKELRACSSPWYGDTFTDMALKTVLKRLLSKRGVLSTEMIEAFKADAKTNDGTTDGLFEMTIADESEPTAEEQKPEVIEVDEPESEPISQPVQQQQPRRGRPPKSATVEKPIEEQKAEPTPLDFDAFGDEF